jgi:hypothetical protein
MLAVNFLQLAVVIAAGMNWEMTLHVFAISPIATRTQLDGRRAGVFRGHLRVLLVAPLAAYR